jgi:hypothetical protein
MDWTPAIDRNRAALLAVVAAILALIGGREGEGPVARRVRSAALALLRPAESAVRRLIVVAARGLALALGPARHFILNLSKDTRAALPVTGGNRTPAFPLFDRPKRFGRLLVVAPPRGVPRIRSFWGAPAAPVAAALPVAAAPPDPDALVDIGRLRVRVASLQAALADLPRQARRLARWQARRAGGDKPCLPLRPGHPPGRRAQAERPIDLVLRDCHALAREALALEALALDTS